MVTDAGKLLGPFLKARRARLDPATYGFSTARRRTPGLRREEVAQRANISAKWYTFLEQGRGGAPSSEVLDRLSRALRLTDAEREHLFHICQPRQWANIEDAYEVSPSLRRLLDAMEYIPAFVKTSVWDIVAWNTAAAATLTDYGALPPGQRNLLRLLFAEPETRTNMADWETHARFAVAAFRRETTRVGLSEAADALVQELSGSSCTFDAMWRDNQVGAYGGGVKHINHKVVGPLMFEYSTLAIDGQPELGLVLFTPATPADLASVKALVRH